MSLAGALVSAAIAALKADAGVTALAGARVHVENVASAPFPHVAIGPVKSRVWNAGGERGEEVSLTLHVFARRGGRGAALELAAACVVALENAALSVDGGHVVGVFFQEVEATLLKDNDTWRAAARFRVLVEAGAT